MSVPRLTFLYPHLFKSARCYDCSAPYRVPRAGRKAGRKAALSTSARGRQETYAQRYGPANDPSSAPPLPPPSPQDQRNTEDPKSLATAIEKEVKSPTPKRDEKESEPTPKTSEKATSAKSSRDTKEPSGVVPTLSSQNADESVNVDASESHPKENVQPSAVPTRKPLERVLKMGSPDEEHKPPHLQAPPYIHHFDTFTLVKNLEQGGFTQAQSITLMKAVRSLLALNLDVAREGLVSKSDVENETYLFRAACSELRTEILSLRRASTARSATQRAHLQHTFDILSQRASQEALALKDDLRGLLNDRKMDVRMQQQARDSAIQELNYKITVILGSGSKSEVEGLRWFLVRRAVGFIVGSAVTVLVVLRYSASRHHAEEEERKKAEAESNTGGGGGGKGGSGTGGGGGDRYTVKSREMGTQTEGEAESVLVKSVEAGGGPSYVSLG